MKISIFIIVFGTILFMICVEQDFIFYNVVTGIALHVSRCFNVGVDYVREWPA